MKNIGKKIFAYFFTYIGTVSILFTQIVEWSPDKNVFSKLNSIFYPLVFFYFAKDITLNIQVGDDELYLETVTGKKKVNINKIISIRKISILKNVVFINRKYSCYACFIESDAIQNVANKCAQSNLNIQIKL